MRATLVAVDSGDEAEPSKSVRAGALCAAAVSLQRLCGEHRPSTCTAPPLVSGETTLETTRVARVKKRDGATQMARLGEWRTRDGAIEECYSFVETLRLRTKVRSCNLRSAERAMSLRAFTKFVVISALAGTSSASITEGTSPLEKGATYTLSGLTSGNHICWQVDYSGIMDLDCLVAGSATAIGTSSGCSGAVTGTTHGLTQPKRPIYLTHCID